MSERFYYGMVGNGETAALIGPDLAIRWLCLPRFDGTPFFASALDPNRGGQLTLCWDGQPSLGPDGEILNLSGHDSVSSGYNARHEARVEQRYIDKTNVLSTAVQANGLKLEAVDAMPWGKSALVRRLTWTNVNADLSGTGDGLHLGFDVHPVQSAQWSFAADLRAMEAPAGPRHVVTVTEGESALAVGWILGAGSDATVAYESTRATALHPDALTVTAPLLHPGESFEVILLLAYGSDRAEAETRWAEAAAVLDERLPGDPAGLRAEIDFWHDWLSRARMPEASPPEFNDAYIRSLLTLKLLTHEQSGAILAAPTASFPAVPGGYDNWDYRYCWIRDGYFTARCFDEAGFHDEARAFYEFALGLQEEDGHWSQPLYTLDGGSPTELLVDDLQGPGGEGPIRFGNAAYDQLQIDNEPSILHGLWIHAQRTGDREFIAANWDAIRRAAEAMSRLWRREENGIWEIRERRDHWVYGKALCCAGFTAAAALAQSLGYDEDAGRWEREAEAVREQVVSEGYSVERGAYLQTYDKNSPLDISALALVLWDVLPADDERIRSTVAAMERPLGLPALALRTTGPTTDDPYWGMHDMKGGLEIDGAFARYDYGAEPFYLPTLWMARHYLRAGQREQAEQLIRLCLNNATNLGLMAEHFNPRTGRQWGNFPQAFSHEELALTILELD